MFPQYTFLWFYLSKHRVRDGAGCGYSGGGVVCLGGASYSTRHVNVAEKTVPGSRLSCRSVHGTHRKPPPVCGVRAPTKPSGHLLRGDAVEIHVYQTCCRHSINTSIYKCIYVVNFGLGTCSDGIGLSHATGVWVGGGCWVVFLPLLRSLGKLYCYCY